MKETPARLRVLEEAVCKISGVALDDLYSRKRDREYSEARMAVWLVAHETMGYSYPYIGRIYGRDHTTIVSGVKKLKNGKAKEVVYAMVQKLCPEVMQKDNFGNAKSIADWRF